jgi:hypothetical protein
MDARGDLLIRCFWARGVPFAFLDVTCLRVTDTDDAKSYCKRAPAKVLESSRHVCLEYRRHFTPFVCSLLSGWYNAFGREAKTCAKRLQQVAAKLANKKWETGSIAIVQATHLCCEEAESPYRYTKSASVPQWEDGAGLSLFEC